MTPIASVIIPACNEGTMIERCLQHLLADAKPDELEVVVVCNGCSDDTSARARAVRSRCVRVIETQKQSKTHALNLGDHSAQCFPRFYLDADIRMSIHAVREVVAHMNAEPAVLLSAPTAVVDDVASAPLVRAYYRVWTKLPYFSESLIGSGVYAFSRRGRARFGCFPDIVSDDEFARRAVEPCFRRTTRGSNFTISAPRTVSALLKVNTRARAGVHQLNAQFPELMQNRSTRPRRTLKTILTTPRLWPDAPVYLAIMFLAELRAHQKRRSKQARVWDRDETSRVGPAEATRPKPHDPRSSVDQSS